MFRTTFDIAGFVRDLSDVEKRQFPYALMRALNDTAFQTRQAWGEEMDRVFDRPTRFTRNAVLYKKATKENFEAEVFIRDEALKGTPPVKYLYWQAEGGQRRQKASERLLQRAGVLSSGEYVVPGRGVQLDAYGNVPTRMLSAILSDVQARRDPQQRSTPQSRKRRSRRKDIGKREVFFYSHGPSGDRGDGRPQHLPRGIYGRTRTGFGSSIRQVLHIVSSARYRKRYPVYALAQRLFDQRFERNLDSWLTIATAGRR